MYRSFLSFLASPMAPAPSTLNQVASRASYGRFYDKAIPLVVIAMPLKHL